MNLNVDDIINFYNEMTNTSYDELTEQDAEGAATGGGDTGGGSTGGGKSPKKWETGIKRGVANQIGVTKWSDILSMNRGKANQIGNTVWTSGRQMGKTGGSDY